MRGIDHQGYTHNNNKNQIPAPGDASPWGPIHNVETLAEGVHFVDTASHGGIWLSNERIGELPAEYDPFTGTRRWAEEDRDAAIVLKHLGLTHLLGSDPGHERETAGPTRGGTDEDDHGLGL